MLWARRIVDPAEWDDVQDQFEGLFTKLGCPGQMMLVGVSASGSNILFGSFPNLTLLNALAGFEYISEGHLPAEASLLIGHPDAFARCFRSAQPKPAS